MVDNKHNNTVPSSRLECLIGIVFTLLALLLTVYVVEMDAYMGTKKIMLLHSMIAIMAGAVVATIPGFFKVSYSRKGVTLRVLGGIAAFLMVLFVFKELQLTAPSVQPLSSPLPSPSSSPSSSFSTQGISPLMMQKAGKEAQERFRITAYCSMTGAAGYAVGEDRMATESAAIQSCVTNGGIQDCCGNNVRVESY